MCLVRNASGDVFYGSWVGSLQFKFAEESKRFENSFAAQVVANFLMLLK